jgi:hypothetical protein
MATGSPGQRLIADCELAIKARQDDFKRGFEIWDAYFAVNGRQWSESKRNDLKANDRHPWQFDVLGPKLETLAGSLAAELPDIDWIPVEGEQTQSVEAVRERYYADKEFFNFHDALLLTIRDGCVHSGWCQLKQSRRYSETGNISLERCRPGYIIPDPYWVTDNDRDLECIFKIGYYTPEQIKRLFPKRSKEIEDAIKRRKDEGYRYNAEITLETRDEQQRQFQSEVGDQFRVIEKFYLKETNSERLVGARHDPMTGQMHMVPFPVTNENAKLQKFAEDNQIDWNDVSPVEYRERRQFIKTVTDLDPELLLEDGETIEQVNGLSFYHFTCQRYNGHDKGVAESILDAQRVINEKESYLLEYMAKAGGGSEIWNEDLFRNQEAKKRFIKNKNKFGHIEFADLDGVKNVKVDVSPAQVPGAVFSEIQRMYNETLPLVSRVSDAMSAIGASEDTGVLYERKYQVNRIANVMYDKYIKTLMNNIGEGYYYQFQITYGDIQMDIPKRLGGSITINKKEVVGNQMMIVNDVSSLPRSKVIVTESKSNPVYQLRKKAEVADIIKSIPQNDMLRMQLALNLYFDNMSMSDEARAQTEMVNQLSMQKALLASMAEMSGYQTQIKNNQVMNEQMNMALAQMQPQPPAQPASPTMEPVPVQGAAAPEPEAEQMPMENSNAMQPV